MNSRTYKNKFGTAVLTPATNIMNVCDISSKLPTAIECSFDMNKAEELALITGNKGIQLVCHYPLNGQVFVILHDSPSMGFICSAYIEDFICDKSAADQIKEMRVNVCY